MNVDIDVFLTSSSHQSTNQLPLLQWKAALLESEVIPLSKSCSAASNSILKRSSVLNYLKPDLLCASFGHGDRLENGQSLLVAAEEVKSITNMPHYAKIIVQHKREHGMDLGSKD